MSDIYIFESHAKPNRCLGRHKIQLTLEETDVALQSGIGTTEGKIERNSMLVKSFTIKPEDIRSTSDWR